MTNLLIIGASGAIARHVVAALPDHPAIKTTLYLRDAAKLADLDTSGMRIVEGDVTDVAKLTQAMQGQDIVYANLTGDMDVLAQGVLDAMDQAGVKRLIFVTSLGIYDEVPGEFGEWNRREIGDYLPPYRRAADIIEASGLNYAVLRPAWLTDADEIAFETTIRGEPFKGTIVSRKSVAALAVDLINHPGRIISLNVGVNKPNSDGDAPDLG